MEITYETGPPETKRAFLIRSKPIHNFLAFLFSVALTGGFIWGMGYKGRERSGLAERRHRANRDHRRFASAHSRRRDLGRVPLEPATDQLVLDHSGNRSIHQFARLSQCATRGGYSGPALACGGTGKGRRGQGDLQDEEPKQNHPPLDPIHRPAGRRARRGVPAQGVSRSR